MLGGFDLRLATVEPLLEHSTKLLAGKAVGAAVGSRLEADHTDVLVPAAVATGVALGLGERPQASHVRHRRRAVGR
jgi:hypothetical protein